MIGSNESERERERERRERERVERERDGRLGERQVESMVAKATTPLIWKLVISYCKGHAREKESERTRNKESREREEKGKAFGISSPLKEDASQEFLIIICLSAAMVE